MSAHPKLRKAGPFKLLCRILTRYSSAALDGMFYGRYGVRVRRIGVSYLPLSMPTNPETNQDGTK